MAGALTAMIAAAFAGGVTPDPYFEYTTLLLPGNGTNGAQNNTFLDSSSNNFTITRNGNTTQGTFSPFSQTGWGNYFNGSSYLLSTATQVIPTGSFTVEAWVYPMVSTDGYIVAQGTSGNAARFSVGIESNVWYAQIGASLVASSAAPVINRWTYIAVTFNGSTLTLYVDGQSVGTPQSTTTSVQNTTLRIGTLGPADWAAAYWTGYISNVRISNTVRSISVPTTPTPFTADANTTFLGCNINRFQYTASAGSFTSLTTGGSPSVVAFSPFNPTLPWSAAAYGGSGYFDGNGDYLTIPDNAAFQLGSNSFCIEGWFYPTTTGDGALISKWAGTAATAAWNIVRISGTLYCQVAYGSSAINASTTDWPLNQWSHIAFVRSGNTLSAYLNGTRFYTNASFSSAVNTGVNGVTVATQSGGTSYPFTGYLSGFRVVNGTAVYDPTQSTITVPTAPLTNITNTSLLLNFTNAGIYDATSKNDLETVGNAQISTTQSKWGGSSMSFDGTGDWLLIPDQPIQRIGTGNFTIEGWVYRNSSGTYGLIGKGTGTTGWLVSLNSSNQVVFTYGSSTITSTGTVSATTWTHIAVVREGTSTNQTKIYINGTNDGTGTVSTNFNQTNSMYVGADRTGGSAANAYMQDVRVTNYARYVTGTGANAGKMVFNGTNDLALPTAAFPTL